MSTIPVSAELLKRLVDPRCDKTRLRARQELRQLLASPQDSAGAVWQAAHERWLQDPNNEPFPGKMHTTPQPAGQAVEVAKGWQLVPAGRAADKREAAAEIARQPRQSEGGQDE